MKAYGLQHLKLEHDELLLSFAFKFNLRHYSWVVFTLPAKELGDRCTMIGRCRLTL
jgi:hypothetical protein